jgi:hypothetical protein
VKTLKSRYCRTGLIDRHVVSYLRQTVSLPRRKDAGSRPSHDRATFDIYSRLKIDSLRNLIGGILARLDNFR